MSVSVRSQCDLCDAGWRAQTFTDDGYIFFWAHEDSDHEIYPCDNYDTEMRHIVEPLGYYIFAWLPKVCRNGRTRWLTWVERHDDGTYTLGNRAH